MPAPKPMTAATLKRLMEAPDDRLAENQEGRADAAWRGIQTGTMLARLVRRRQGDEDWENIWPWDVAAG